MAPPYRSSTLAYTLGPGPLTPAIKALVIANVVGFLLTLIVPELTVRLGLLPEAVLERLEVWQPVTYMFLHGGFFHLLFNMLTLWMFGVELEKMWGSSFFTKYYFVTGVGAAATQIVVSLLPGIGAQFYYALTIGASGAVYGVLLAYAMYFPNRPIYMYLVFPIPAKYFVMIMGAVSFLSSLGGPGGVAHWAHLGGLLTGYLFLRGRRLRLASEIEYQFTKWRLNRARRRFDVHRGGRADDRDRRIH
jgi:membrane associated rhomboid family serine protease